MKIFDLHCIGCYTVSMLEVLKDAILSNIGALKSAPNGWFKQNCRLCHTRGHGRDTRHRFGIQFNTSTKSIILHCFNCGYKAAYTDGKGLSQPFKTFLKIIDIDELFIKKFELEIFKQKNNIQIVREGDDEKLEQSIIFQPLTSKWKTAHLPNDSMSITDWLSGGLTDTNFMRVVDYAINRRIFNLDNFYWTPTKENNLNQRLIIPYYHKNRMVGFTSRLCYDTDNKNIPKYFQHIPTDFVYNLDNQQNWLRKYVIVNEGVLDAWFTDGVSTLGEITQGKIDLINGLQKEVIVCPDKDKKGYDLVKAAIDNNWAVSFPKWDLLIKDASEATEKYGKLLTTQSIITSAIRDEVNIELKWNIEYAERQRRTEWIKRK